MKIIIKKVTVPVCMFPMATLGSSDLRVLEIGHVILRFSKNVIQGTDNYFV